MSQIQKIDSNGVKPLLNVGQLGYDNYPAGGDKGRVYVGDGTENIAISKKSELDAHKATTNNPHAVTKTQVGLGSVDNTADSTKMVASAAKLTTARTLGGVSFDGTANINLPGVNAAGNQNTSGNAATATKLAATKTINGVAFDGSANIVVADSTKVAKTSDTGSAQLPVGTTAQRDAVPVEGMIRYNSTTLGFEGYSNGIWQPVGGGQMLGQSLIKAVSYNAQTISENITVPAGLNAYSVGDVTIANGHTMTIENGSVYKIL